MDSHPGRGGGKGSKDFQYTNAESHVQNLTSGQSHGLASQKSLSSFNSASLICVWFLSLLKSTVVDSMSTYEGQ